MPTRSPPIVWQQGIVFFFGLGRFLLAISEIDLFAGNGEISRNLPPPPPYYSYHLSFSDIPAIQDPVSAITKLFSSCLEKKVFCRRRFPFFPSGTWSTLFNRVFFSLCPPVLRLNAGIDLFHFPLLFCTYFPCTFM